MTKARTLETEHKDYAKWLKELDFVNDELKLFEHQLGQLIGGADKKSLPRFEHFQNAFLRQHEVIDELSHDIRMLDQELISVRDGKQIHLVDKVLDYDKVAARMKTCIDLYRELKDEFVQFVHRLIGQSSP